MSKDCSDNITIISNVTTAIVTAILSVAGTSYYFYKHNHTNNAIIYSSVKKKSKDGSSTESTELKISHDADQISRTSKATIMRANNEANHGQTESIIEDSSSNEKPLLHDKTLDFEETAVQDSDSNLSTIDEEEGGGDTGGINKFCGLVSSILRLGSSTSSQKNVLVATIADTIAQGNSGFIGASTHAIQPLKHNHHNNFNTHNKPIVASSDSKEDLSIEVFQGRDNKHHFLINHSETYSDRGLMAYTLGEPSE